MDIHYLAGFFDGEGCICITEKTDKEAKRGIGYRIIVDVSQKKPEVLELFKERWGGSILNGKRCKRWTVYSENALSALIDLAPYLQIKRQQAELGILFQLRKRERKRRGSKGITDEEFEFDRQSQRRMHFLNHS